MGPDQKRDLIYSVYHKGISYKLVLFKHKRTRHFWMDACPDTFNNQTVFSGRFGTIGEAQGDSWASLMTI